MAATTFFHWQWLGIVTVTFTSFWIMPDIGGGLTAFLGEAAPDPGGGAALPTVQDEFGLQWVGAFQDEPSLDLLKRCVQGTKLACYCPAGLIVGKLTKSNSRSSTGVTFELGEVITYPAGLAEQVAATRGLVHLCKHRPCRREEATSSYASKQQSVHCYGVAPAPIEEVEQGFWPTVLQSRQRFHAALPPPTSTVTAAINRLEASQLGAAASDSAAAAREEALRTGSEGVSVAPATATQSSASGSTFSVVHLEEAGSSEPPVPGPGPLKPLGRLRTKGERIRSRTPSSRASSVRSSREARTTSVVGNVPELPVQQVEPTQAYAQEATVVPLANEPGYETPVCHAMATPPGQTRVSEVPSAVPQLLIPGGLSSDSEQEYSRQRAEACNPDGGPLPNRRGLAGALEDVEWAWSSTRAAGQRMWAWSATAFKALQQGRPGAWAILVAVILLAFRTKLPSWGRQRLSGMVYVMAAAVGFDVTIELKDIVTSAWTEYVLPAARLGGATFVVLKAGQWFAQRNPTWWTRIWNRGGDHVEGPAPAHAGAGGTTSGGASTSSSQGGTGPRAQPEPQPASTSASSKTGPGSPDGLAGATVCQGPDVYWKEGETMRLARQCKIAPESTTTRLLDEDFVVSVSQSDLINNPVHLCKHHGPTYRQRRYPQQCCVEGCWKVGHTLLELGLDETNVPAAGRHFKHCGEHALRLVRQQLERAGEHGTFEWVDEFEKVLARAPDTVAARAGYVTSQNGVSPSIYEVGLEARAVEVADEKRMTVPKVWAIVVEKSKSADLRCLAGQYLKGGITPATRGVERPTELQPAGSHFVPEGSVRTGYCAGCSSWLPQLHGCLHCSKGWCDKCWSGTPPVFRRCPSCQPHAQTFSPSAEEARGYNQRAAWGQTTSWPSGEAVPPPPAGSAGYAGVNPFAPPGMGQAPWRPSVGQLGPNLPGATGPWQERPPSTPWSPPTTSSTSRLATNPLFEGAREDQTGIQRNPSTGVYGASVLQPQLAPQLVTDPALQIVGAIRADLVTHTEAMCKAWSKDKDDGRMRDRGTYSGFMHEDVLTRVIMVGNSKVTHCPHVHGGRKWAEELLRKVREERLRLVDEGTPVRPCPYIALAVGQLSFGVPWHGETPKVSLRVEHFPDVSAPDLTHWKAQAEGDYTLKPHSSKPGTMAQFVQQATHMSFFIGQCLGRVHEESINKAVQRLKDFYQSNPRVWDVELCTKVFHALLSWWITAWRRTARHVAQLTGRDEPTVAEFVRVCQTLDPQGLPHFSEPNTFDLDDPSGPFQREIIQQASTTLQQDMWATQLKQAGSSYVVQPKHPRAGGAQYPMSQVSQVHVREAVRHTPICPETGLRICWEFNCHSGCRKTADGGKCPHAHRRFPGAKKGGSTGLPLEVRRMLVYYGGLASGKVITKEKFPGVLQALEEQITNERTARRNDIPEDRLKSTKGGTEKGGKGGGKGTDKSGGKGTDAGAASAKAKGRNGPRAGAEQDQGSRQSATTQPEIPEELNATEDANADNESKVRAGSERNKPSRAERRRKATEKKKTGAEAAGEDMPQTTLESKPPQAEVQSPTAKAKAKPKGRAAGSEAGDGSTAGRAPFSEMLTGAEQELAGLVTEKGGEWLTEATRPVEAVPEGLASASGSTLRDQDEAHSKRKRLVTHLKKLEPLRRLDGATEHLSSWVVGLVIHDAERQGFTEPGAEWTRQSLDRALHYAAGCGLPEARAEAKILAGEEAATRAGATAVPVVLHEPDKWKGVATQKVEVGRLEMTAVDFGQYLEITPKLATYLGGGDTTDTGSRKAGEMESNQCLPLAAAGALELTTAVDPWEEVTVAGVSRRAQAIRIHHAAAAAGAAGALGSPTDYLPEGEADIRSAIHDALEPDHDHDLDVMDYFKPQWYCDEAIDDSWTDEEELVEGDASASTQSQVSPCTSLAEDQLIYRKEAKGYLPNVTWWILEVEPFGSTLRLYQSTEEGEDEGGMGLPAIHCWMMLRDGHMWALVPHAPPDGLAAEAKAEGRRSQFEMGDDLHFEDYMYELYTEYGTPAIQRDMVGWRRRLERIAGMGDYAAGYEVEEANHPMTARADLLPCPVCKRRKVNIKIRRRTDASGFRGAGDETTEYDTRCWGEVMELTGIPFSLGTYATIYTRRLILKAWESLPYPSTGVQFEVSEAPMEGRLHFSASADRWSLEPCWIHTDCPRFWTLVEEEKGEKHTHSMDIPVYETWAPSNRRKSYQGIRPDTTPGERRSLPQM